MKTKLDIKKLLEKAEELVYDGKIEFSESCEIPVQIMESNDGSKYQLKLVMTMI